MTKEEALKALHELAADDNHRWAQDVEIAVAAAAAYHAIYSRITGTNYDFEVPDLEAVQAGRRLTVVPLR